MGTSEFASATSFKFSIESADEQEFDPDSKSHRAEGKTFFSSHKLADDLLSESFVFANCFPNEGAKFLMNFN